MMKDSLRAYRVSTFLATVQQVQSVFFIGMQCLGPQAWDWPGRDHKLGVVRGLKVAECQK